MGKICGIYCIENLVNGKKYIGQSVDIYKRWSRHKNELLGNRHKNDHLQSSWNKYGKNNFKFYIIQECSMDELDMLESYYIRTFNTIDRFYGYNRDSGGHYSKVLSDETKRKIGEAHKNKPLSEEHKQKISAAGKGRVFSDDSKLKISQKLTGIKRSEEYCVKKSEAMTGVNNPNYGVRRSEDTKAKIAKGVSKPIYCVELNTIFESGKQAEEITGVSRHNISACRNGRRKYAGRHPITGEPLHWEDATRLTIQN